jgi:hypothetical protein
LTGLLESRPHPAKRVLKVHLTGIPGQIFCGLNGRAAEAQGQD